MIEKAYTSHHSTVYSLPNRLTLGYGLVDVNANATSASTASRSALLHTCAL